MIDLKKIRFWSGFLAAFLILVAVTITGTFYSTRLPLGTLTTHATLAEVR